MRYYLAIDIGASSGRHIVGWMEQGTLQTEEVYRFPNGVKTEQGHLVWDTAALLREVKAGIAAAKAKYPKLESLSIDTWGVDYVLLEGERELLPAYAYRDSRTEAVIPRVHEKVPFSELYRRTGCQFQPFTTIYQLSDDLQNGRLERATDFLMMPEYLMYKLTGVKAKEYTEGTTTGLVSAETGEFDLELVRRLGLPERLFPRLTPPGTVIGTYEDIPVTFCATHDTGSAVEGIPMEGSAPYISSGTWSLLGIKTEKPITCEAGEKANYANEGGVGYNRFQKNIMGLWLVQELRRELCPGADFGDIAAAAAASNYDGLIDANDSAFLSPTSMKAAFDDALTVKPTAMADYFRCAYRSLARSYRQALDELEAITGKACDRLYIVGGGAKNPYLNRLTEEATGKTVIALPIEATAMGNLLVQMRCGHDKI